MIDLRFPIGEFAPVASLDEAGRARCINEIAELPAKMREAVRGLDARGLDTPYRPGGWTVRQVVHHVPDSHVNAYIRMKLAVTESTPTIKPYDEKSWADLPDGKIADPAVSLALIDALHARWVLFLRALAPADFARTFHHPEAGTMRVDQAVAQYAWHGRHHAAQITHLRERERI